MLQCNAVVTLVQAEKSDDDDWYTCTVICGASWFAKTAVAQNATSLQPANVLICRIPVGNLPEGVRPQNGDFLVRGILESATRREDWKDREHFQITAVGDNRRGKFPHWKVSGA